MENSKRVIAAARQVFDQLKELDSKTIKDLLKTRAKGDVCKYLTELYHFNDCEEGNYRCCMDKNKVVIDLTCSTQKSSVEPGTNGNHYGMIEQKLWALAA
ncbi:hypothetical protein [Desulfobacter curvatus]|uniref:hypothetical protein n=1 Tax=Desulfobacter curvatus TaxID=2290 RepID=UPI00037A5F3F|nr:hypothetical protein [Desulfobacter curvatus]